jgi:hypothetical protein
MYKSEEKRNMLSFIKNTDRQLVREKTKSISLLAKEPRIQQVP